MTIKHNYNTEDGFNQKYDEAIALPFTLAKNSLYENKIINKYRGFHSYIEMEQFIKSIAQMKQKVYFEILTDDNTKPFFDIDKSSFTFEEYDIFLIEFIDAFNTFFKQNITQTDLLIYYRDDNTQKNTITSSHIIIKPFNTSRNNIKLFLSYFNKYLDDKIYTKNRLFNLPYNTKIKYIDGSFNDKCFIDYHPLEKGDTKQNSMGLRERRVPLIKDYLVSYTLNTIKLNIPKYHLLVTKLQKLDKIITKNNTKLLKNAFKKLKQNASFTVTEPIEIKKIYFNTINSSFDFLIDSLPNEFYLNTNDWKMLTNLLKKYGITKEQAKKWNNISSINSNHKWSEVTNTSFYNSIDTSKIKSGKPTYKTIIQKYLQIDIVLDYDDELIKWLANETGINCDWIKEIDSSIIKIILGKDNDETKYEYNTKNGFLKNNENKILGNYFYDISLKNIHQINSDDKKIINLNHIDEIEPFLKEFNNKTKGVFSVKAKWGTGKTHKIIREIIENAKLKKIRIIMLSENNALNLKFSNDFNFQTHIKNSKIDQSKNIVCSTESIQKIIFNENDILILDEFETLINHFESDTFDNKEYDKFKLFRDAITLVNKIIILDADISSERISLIEKMRNEQITTYNINQNNFSDYKFFVYETKSDFILNIKNVMKTDKKILIASSSKTENDNFYIDFKNQSSFKRILKIDSEGAFFFNGNEEKLDKHNTLNNLESVIMDYDIDVFLFSPTIKTGVSINTEYFNVCYGYAHNKSVCSREFIQMLFRSRNLKDKEIHIAFNTSFRPIKPYIEKNRLKEYILNPILLFQSKHLFTDDNTYSINSKEEKFNNIIKNIDEDYLFLKVINLNENHNSSKFFTQDILTRIKYNHNIKIDYVCSNNDDDDDDKETNEPNEMNDEEKNKLFVNIELPTHHQVKTQNLKWKPICKYNFFYEDYFIKGITDCYDCNPIVYHIINNWRYYNRYNNPDIKKKYNLIKFIYNNELEEKTDYLVQDGYKNKINKTEHYIGKSKIILDVLKNINIDMKTLPITKTNKEFNALLMNFNLTDFQKDINNYFTNYELEYHTQIDFNDKKNYIKNVKNAIHYLLNEIGINFKYENEKHTSRDYDKIIFYFDDFNTEKSLYQGRLINNHFQTDKVKKFKKGFKTIDGLTDLYKQSLKGFSGEKKDYYTTYKVKQNKSINYLANRITDETLYIDLMNHILNKELKNYLCNKFRPYIIDEYEYKTKLVKTLL